MRSAFSQVLLFACVVSSHNLQARDVVNIGPSGVCPALATTTVVLQPVYCHEYFPYNTVVVPFRDGVPFTVSHAPTDVQISSTLTRTLPLGSVPTTYTPPSQSIGTTDSTPSGASVSPTTINPAASSSNIYSQTVSPVSTTSAASGNNLFLGQGLPSGSVTVLPDFIFLAASNFGPQPSSPSSPLRVRQVQHARRQVPAPDVSPLTLVNLAQPTNAIVGGLSQDDCDDSSPLILRQGSLLQFDRNVDKYVGSTDAQLGFLDQTSTPRINTTFALVNGFLQWDAPDVGLATFWDCDGSFYAGFPEVSVAEFCIQIEIGAIAGQACRDRVQQTAQVNPVFTAPILALTTTSSVFAPTFPASSTSTSENTGTPTPNPISQGTTGSTTSSSTSADQGDRISVLSPSSQKPSSVLSKGTVLESTTRGESTSLTPSSSTSSATTSTSTTASITASLSASTSTSASTSASATVSTSTTAISTASITGSTPATVSTSITESTTLGTIGGSSVDTTTTTTTSTTTSTAPSHTIAAPRCNRNLDPENGLCSDNCACVDDPTGASYCGSAYTDPSTPCSNSNVCPQGTFSYADARYCVTGTEPNDMCTSSYNPGSKRRDLFGDFVAMRVGRMSRR